FRPCPGGRRELDALVMEADNHEVLRYAQDDRGIELVDVGRLVAPARIAIDLRIESFGDEIARRPAEAAAFVESAQAALQCAFGDLLDAQVERRVDLEAAVVEVLRAELLVLSFVLLDVLADLLGEVG